MSTTSQFAHRPTTDCRTARTPSFTVWLRAQVNRDDRVGDLARDAVRDERWPGLARPLSVFEQHLDQMGACDAALDALAAAHREYEGRAH